VIAFLVFLLLMKRKYLATFSSVQTRNWWAQGYFLNEENSDEIRVVLVNFNCRQWQSIRGRVRN